MADIKACSSCNKPRQAKDNVPGCAPLMADGRLFTNWTPRCAQVYMSETSKSSYEARQHLIENAKDIMKKNAGDAYILARCGPCYENPDWNSGTMLPELNTQTCNERTCTFAPNNNSGLGLGRQYWNPKMESAYQTKFLEEKEKEQSFFKEGASINPFNAEFMPYEQNL
jgi:hypothetical protein